MKKVTQKEIERAEAVERLRELLPPGSTVRTILRHVSASGMTRAISPVIDCEDYSWLVARATEDKVNQRHGGITMGGCGMDMGFALVNNLSRTLYPDGFPCLGERCPAPDHVNSGTRENWRGDTAGRQHKGSDGAYAISHRWL